MPSAIPSSPPLRAFAPGTTGWTAADLNDPAIDAQWDAGRYEIIEGALVTMPAAYYDAARAFRRLLRTIERRLEDTGAPGELAGETDLVISDTRVVRADAVFMRPEDEQRQRQADPQWRGRSDLTFGRLVVPPWLIIESISIGHEAHDRVVKRRWYAEFGIPHYWVFDSFVRRLECLVLDGAVYRTDAIASGAEENRPAAFPGLVIRLGRIWV